MHVRRATVDDFQAMMRVASCLHPKWFDAFAICSSLPLDLRIHRGFVAKEEGRVVGFVTYTSNEGEVKISWIGVDPGLHRHGIGTMLIRAVEEQLGGMGIEYLRVDTVAESTQYEPYEMTRAFYERMGFTVERVREIESKDGGGRFHLATYLKRLSGVTSDG